MTWQDARYLRLGTRVEFGNTTFDPNVQISPPENNSAKGLAGHVGKNVIWTS
jgi:hypothetical protein